MPAPLKLGIIGDVHAEHHRLTLTLDYLYNQGINQIACTGDLSDGVGDLDETV
jgi:predicted phosphodiesterase